MLGAGPSVDRLLDGGAHAQRAPDLAEAHIELGFEGRMTLQVSFAPVERPALDQFEVEICHTAGDAAQQATPLRGGSSERRGQGMPDPLESRRMARVSICIDVSDLPLATRFYCDAIGCLLENPEIAQHAFLRRRDGTAAAESRGNESEQYTRLHSDL
jgi:hypothetical protein